MTAKRQTSVRVHFKRTNKKYNRIEGKTKNGFNRKSVCLLTICGVAFLIFFEAATCSRLSLFSISIELPTTNTQKTERERERQRRRSLGTYTLHYTYQWRWYRLMPYNIIIKMLLQTNALCDIVWLETSLDAFIAYRINYHSIYLPSRIDAIALSLTENRLNFSFNFQCFAICYRLFIINFSLSCKLNTRRCSFHMICTLEQHLDRVNKNKTKALTIDW